MIRFYIRAAYSATMQMFATGDMSVVDRIDAVNSNTLGEIYRLICAGVYDYAHSERKRRVALYTRATHGEGVQRTDFFRDADGGLIPESHEIFRDASSFTRVAQSYPHGGYINIHRL